MDSFCFNNSSLQASWKFIKHRSETEYHHPRAIIYAKFFFFFSKKLVYAKEPRRLCPDLVVCPAGLPHAQSFGVGELSLEAEQDPAVAEEKLEAVLPESGQVLVEAGQHEPQQLPQVHLWRVGEGTHRLTNTIEWWYFPLVF